MTNAPRNMLFCTFSLVAIALTGCGQPAGQSESPAVPTPIPVTVTVPGKQELTICTTNEPENLIGNGGAAPLWEAVGLAAAGPDGAFGAQPRALIELPTPENGDLLRNPDGTLSATLRYRDDLTWSDGQPFSAADALLGMLAAPSPEVLDVETLDDFTLNVTLARDAGYPYVPVAPPLPSHVLEGLDVEAIANSAYAGLIDPALGPYVMAEWMRGESTTLVANPHYAGGAPAIPTLHFRFLPDSATLTGELLAGNCDVAADDSLSVADLPALQQGVQQGQAQLVAGPGALWEHLDFNTAPGGGRVPYFADVRVRQAVAHALNREALAQSVGLGFVTPLDSWLPTDHWAYPADPTALVSYPYDPTRAQALLSEAGWRDGNGDGVLEYAGPGGEYGCLRGVWTIEEGTPLAVTLVTSANDDLRASIASQLQADLAAAGIRLDIQAVEPAALFDPQGPLARREFDLALFAWPTAPEPRGDNWWLGADLYRHPLSDEVVHNWQLEDRFARASVEKLAPSNIPSPTNDYRGQNLTGWCNEAANLAIYQATRALSLPDRQAAYAEQQALFAQALPTLPLFQHLRIAAHRPDVCGIAPGPYAPLTWNVAAWYGDPTGACGS